MRQDDHGQPSQQAPNGSDLVFDFSGVGHVDLGGLSLLLTARQLAEILQVSESTVHRLRRSGRIPAVLLTDRLIRFNLKDVQKALKSALASRDGEQDQDSATSQLSFEDFFSDFNI